MVTAVFSTTYGNTGGSVLTLNPPGEAKQGEAVSVFDLAKERGLKDVVIVDDRIDGLLAAYKVATKLGVKLCFGVKFTICNDHRNKQPESRRTESKVTVMVRNTEGYSDLIRLYNRAWTDGYFTFRQTNYGRLDWGLLNKFWSPNLLLVLPYFSSFLARNTLTFNQITPELPCVPQLFKEVDCALPFVPLIDAAVDRYATASGAPVWSTKSVFYNTRADFKAYTVYRCLYQKSSYDEPKLEHFSVHTFCWERYKEIEPLC